MGRDDPAEKRGRDDPAEKMGRDDPAEKRGETILIEMTSPQRRSRAKGRGRFSCEQSELRKPGEGEIFVPPLGTDPFFLLQFFHKLT